MKMQAPTVSTYLSQKALSWQEHDSLNFFYNLTIETQYTKNKVYWQDVFKAFLQALVSVIMNIGEIKTK